ncbi:hypothetical protein M513_10657 [Trichuris suis]|uniref:DUF1758 domain-containing protein n=1 Tax=Trichuris suis TaxID=68888 RepID=A0A085LTZ3_9BILA|nr:hypothetical protein M513_10657 [Trichuris suis]
MSSLLTRQYQRTLEHIRSKESVFLQTDQGTLKSASGGRSNATDLLDVGSQISFVRKDIAEGLRLESHNERVIISTLGGKLSKIGKHKCIAFTLCSKGGGKRTLVSALCVDRTCSVLESNPPSKEEWSHLQGVTLRDSCPLGPATVDVLISADYYHDFMKSGLNCVAKSASP